MCTKSKLFQKIAGQEAKDLDNNFNAQTIESKICPDCYVAAIEVEFHQNNGHVKYVENSITNYDGRIKMDKILRNKDYPIIAIILESPHINEYKNNESISPLKNPLSANTLNDFFIRNFYNYVTAAYSGGAIFSRNVVDIENGIYRIKLVNAIQFQCSLVRELKNAVNQDLKNRIVEQCLNETLFQNDFIKRIQDATIIINCCTGQKDGQIDGLQKQVQEIIDNNYSTKLRLYGYHPSSLHFIKGFKKVL